MKKYGIKKILGVLIVPVGISMVLVPYSMLVGWNIVSMLFFWFLMVPAAASYLPFILQNDRRNHYSQSLLGLLLFYSIMIIMIHDHFQSDYFKLMLISGLINLCSVTAVAWKRSLIRKPQLKI